MPALLATLVALLCFTVALLSFSRPDYRRFAQVAEGLETGFGRAGALQEEPVPLGSSVVSRAFVPEGEPVPVDAAWTGSGQLPPLDVSPVAASVRADAPPPEQVAAVKAGVDALIAGTRAGAGSLAARLTQGISRGEVEIETRGRTVVLRLLESGSFAANASRLEPAMRVQLEELGAALGVDPASLVLRAYHAGARTTDASDWSLSAGRAAAVADALQARNAALAARLTVIAYGATQPPPDARTRPGRGNRVEIVITRSLTPELAASLDSLREDAPQAALTFEKMLDPTATEAP